MHQQREGFSGGKFKFPVDFGDFSDSTAVSSLSSPDVDPDEMEAWQRRPSRFVEQTFKDSATSQDDMALHSRKSLEMPKHKPSYKPKSKKHKRKSTKDDSQVGNYHLKPRLRQNPNDTQQSKQRYVLQKQDGKLALSNTTVESELTKSRSERDLSRSLVDKLGRSPVMNRAKNKAAGRRRASVNVLTGTEEEHKEPDGRERARANSPVRRGRSHSLSARYRREEPNETDPHGSRHRHGRLHHRSRSGDGHKRKDDNYLGTPSHEDLLADRSASPAEGSSRRNSPNGSPSSRRHSPNADESSRRNHGTGHSRRHKRGSDSHSPTHKSEHRRHREHDTEHKRQRDGNSAHSSHPRRRRSHSERSNEREKHDRNRDHDHGHRRHRSHSLSPKGRGGHDRPPRDSPHDSKHRRGGDTTHDRHGRPRRRNQTENEKRKNQSPSDLVQKPAETDSAPPPVLGGRRTTRGSMIVINAPPTALPVANKSKDKHRDKHHHRDERHGGHKGRGHGHKGRGHDGERKKRPKLTRFRSKSTGHVPTKRGSRRDSQGRPPEEHDKTHHTRNTAKGRQKGRHGKASHEDLHSLNSRKEREEAVATAASGQKVAVSPRNRRLSVDMVARKEERPPPVIPQSGLSPRRRMQDSKTPSTRQLTMDAGRRRSISPNRRGLTNQNTGSKSSRFKQALLKQASMEEESERVESRPVVRRSSSLSKLETKSRKSLFIGQPQANDRMPLLSRSRMGFLDESISFSDSDENEMSSRQMSQDRLVRSIQDRLHASEVSQKSDDDDLEFDVTDDKDGAIAITHMKPAKCRLRENLDYVDLTALRASEIQEVLARAGALE